MNTLETARLNMVESQVRTGDVTDRRILRAMSVLPRELFVPSSVRSLAYMDEEIKLKAASSETPARYMMAALPLAKLLQLAEVNSTDLVLDIGCATGYSTVLLAHLAESVVGLESDVGLAEQAKKNLLELAADNAAVVAAPLQDGYASEGPYDVIIINGAIPAVPDKILAQLKQNGHLISVLSETGFGKACIFKKSQNDVSKRAYFDLSVPILPGFEKAVEFVF